MTSLFSRLQKLNKEATPPDCGAWRWFGLLARTDDGEPNATDAELIVECRNSLPAVLNLIEAAQWAREESQQLVGMDDPFGSQGPPILIGANAWFALADAVAVFVSGQEEPR